jgi:hypothetical protein
MLKPRKKTKVKQKQSRNRSDLLVDEFGAKTRYKDASMTPHALSPHWNEEGKV